MVTEAREGLPLRGNADLEVRAPQWQLRLGSAGVERL
jgi:hypothetical protein